MKKIYDIKLGTTQRELQQFARWLRTKGHKVKIATRKHSMVDGLCTSKSIRASNTIETLFVKFCSQSPEPIIAQQLSVVDMAREAAANAGTEIEPKPHNYSNPKSTEYATKDGRTVRILLANQDSSKEES